MKRLICVLAIMLAMTGMAWADDDYCEICGAELASQNRTPVNIHHGAWSSPDSLFFVNLCLTCGIKHKEAFLEHIKESASSWIEARRIENRDTFLLNRGPILEGQIRELQAELDRLRGER